MMRMKQLLGIASEEYNTPPEDLANKPPDIVEYAFAPACEAGHVIGFGEKGLSVEDLSKIFICQECGNTAKMKIVRRYAEAKWRPSFVGHPNTKWWWTQTCYGHIAWNRAEVVKEI